MGSFSLDFKFSLGVGLFACGEVKGLLGCEEVSAACGFFVVAGGDAETDLGSDFVGECEGLFGFVIEHFPFCLETDLPCCKGKIDLVYVTALDGHKDIERLVRGKLEDSLSHKINSTQLETTVNS
jgi:hypothetical protein